MLHRYLVSVAILAFTLLSGCTDIKRLADIPVATGYVAHSLCTRLFVSEQNEARVIANVLEPKLTPLDKIWHLDINHQEKSVAVSAPFFAGLNQATAIYRKNIGCTLVVDNQLADIHIQTLSEEPHPDRLIKTSEIGAAKDFTQALFNEDQLSLRSKNNTYAALVFHDGQLIAEQYAEGLGPDNRLLAWSMSKTVIALLLGMLEQDGKIKLDSPMPFIDWQGSDKQQISLRHLLNMTSGLKWHEDYEKTSDVGRMMYLSSNQAEYVKSHELIHPPGSYFYYSTGDSMLIADYLTKQIGGSLQHVYDFYQKELFQKLAIHNAFIEVDESGTLIGGARVIMSPRDWGKIGQLMLQQGTWKGEQLVSKQWIRFMTTGSAATDLYGGQTWLYDSSVMGAGIPKDTFFLYGYQGQYVVVIPSLKLVVVRQGALGPDTSVMESRQQLFKQISQLIQQLPHQLHLSNR